MLIDRLCGKLFRRAI